jgi:hypothetical protein
MIFSRGPIDWEAVMANATFRSETARGAWMADDRTVAAKKLKVFISYSRKDLAFAQHIVAGLEARGLAPKIDTRDLPKLEDWRREL